MPREIEVAKGDASTHSCITCELLPHHSGRPVHELGNFGVALLNERASFQVG
jgi:hypothetical protein